MGNAYRNLKHFRKSISCYEQQINICRTISYLPSEGGARFNGALSWRDLSEYKTAIEWLKEAVSILTSIEDPCAKDARALLAKWIAETEPGSDA